MGDQKVAGREEEMQGRVVCVTGASGYLATWLVRTLLQRGCFVHATVRNLGSEKKTEVLRGLPGAAERLALFEADMYDAATFEPAIAGCEFVFLVATPLLHDATSAKYKDTTEAAVDAHRIILQLCERSGTVKRVVHTGSVMSASPLREDGDGYKEFVDESCWTPLHLSCGRSNAYLDDYVSSKILSEKELLKYNTAADGSDQAASRAFDVVVLACALVGGDTLLPYVPDNDSINIMLSPLTGVEPDHTALKFLQVLLGSVPLVHVNDACEAHVLCMDTAAVAAGRYLCVAGHPNMQDVVEHYARKHPELKLVTTEVVGEGVRVKASTNKLVELGFQYSYGPEEVLDGSVECGKRLGAL